MIIVRSCDVQFNRQLSLLDRLDPYLKIFYGGQHRKSEIKHHGGLNPRWDQPFLFDLGTSTELRVQIWDRDRWSPDDMVGAGCVDISDLIGVPPGSTKVMPVDLYCHGQLTGVINMRIEVGGTLEQSQVLAQNLSIMNATKTSYNQQKSSYPDKTMANSSFQQSFYPDKTAPTNTQQQGFYNASKAATSSTTAANQYLRQQQQQQQAFQTQSSFGLGQRPQQPPTQQSSLPMQTSYQNGFGLRR